MGLVMRSNIRTYSKDEQLVASRRKEIALAAASVFVKKGYEQTSIREIGDRSGMGRGTLYHYVGSKEDILYLVATLGREHYADFFKKADILIKTVNETVNATQALQEAIKDFYSKVGERQDIMLFFYQGARKLPPAMRKEVLDWEEDVVGIFERLLAKGCDSGEFEIDDIVTVAHHIVCGGEMWATRRWFLKRRYTLEQYIGKETEFFLRAVGQGMEGEKPKLRGNLVLLEEVDKGL